MWGDGTNVFVADAVGNTIGRFNLTTEQLTTVAGSPPPARVSQDGIGSGARFVNPTTITGDGSTLYLIDGTQTGYVRSISLATKETRRLDIPLPRSLWSDGTYLYLSYGKTVERMSIATGQRQVLADSFSTPGGMWGDGANLYVFDGIAGPSTCTNPFCGGPPITRYVRKINLATREVSTLSAKPNSFVPASVWADGQYLYAPDGAGVDRTSLITGDRSSL